MMAIGFDADRVLLDSRLLAWQAASMSHRSAMRRAASGLPQFPASLAVADRQPLPSIISTTALALDVRTALGPHAGLFEWITGFKMGCKPGLLGSVAHRLAAVLPRFHPYRPAKHKETEHAIP